MRLDTLMVSSLFLFLLSSPGTDFNGPVWVINEKGYIPFIDGYEPCYDSYGRRSPVTVNTNGAYFVDSGGGVSHISVDVISYGRIIIAGRE